MGSTFGRCDSFAQARAALTFLATRYRGIEVKMRGDGFDFCFESNDGAIFASLADAKNSLEGFLAGWTAIQDCQRIGGSISPPPPPRR